MTPKGIRKKEDKSYILSKHQSCLNDFRTQMFQVSEKEFKITMTNMLKSLIEKADNMQEQMNNVSRQREILRKKQKEMLEIKIILRETFKKCL